MSRQAISHAWQRKRPLAVLIIASALAGCATLDTQPEKEQPVAAEWANRGAVPHAPSVDPALWWKAFDEPVLDALVAQALAQNLSLAQAGYRLQAAQSLVRTAAAQRLPQVNATAEGHRKQRLSGPGDMEFGRNERSSEGDQPLREQARASGYYQAGFGAFWELDLFGRLAATEDAARATEGTALVESRMARVSVVAEVVRSYSELRGAQRRLALQEENLKDQDRLVALTRSRRIAGIANDLDVDRSLTTASEIAAQLPLLGQSIQQSAQRIAVLTGQATVDRRLLEPMPQPVAERLALRVLPADLVRVRPEIQRAERLIAQASAELGIAVADLFPRMTLVGDITASGNLIGAPLPGRATNAASGLSISIPLLDWASRRAVVNAREAGLAEAIIAYRLAVLEGIEETENALDAVEAGRRKAREEATRLAAARRTAAHADTLYRRGVTNLLDRLDAATALREAQMSTSDVVEQQALAVVALYKAVGGGGQEPSQ